MKKCTSAFCVIMMIISLSVAGQDTLTQNRMNSTGVVEAIVIDNKADSSQGGSSNKLGFYPSVLFQTGFPTGAFKNNFDKNALLGFSMDGVIAPIKKNHFWQAGAQLEIFFTNSKKGTWKGIEVETESLFYKFNLISRIQPFYSGNIDPFIELAYGANISSTNTNYEIVDEATFLEKYLFDQEDEIITEQLKDFTSLSSNYAIGIGAFIKHVIMVQVKYNLSPEIGFVKKDDIVVKNSRIDYNATRSKMNTITVCIGFAIKTSKYEMKDPNPYTFHTDEFQ